MDAAVAVAVVVLTMIAVEGSLFEITVSSVALRTVFAAHDLASVLPFMTTRLMLVVVVVVVRNQAVNDLLQQVDQEEADTDGQLNGRDPVAVVMRLIAAVIVRVRLVYFVYQVQMMIFFFFFIRIVMVTFMLIVLIGCLVVQAVGSTVFRFPSLLPFQVVVQVFPDLRHQVDETSGQQDSAAQKHQHLHQAVIREPLVAVGR